MKTAIVVSRKWQQPTIEAFMSKEEIGAKMAVEDFLKSLVAEMKSPFSVMTKDALLKRMLTAWETIEKELKDSTRYV